MCVIQRVLKRQSNNVAEGIGNIILNIKCMHSEKSTPGDARVDPDALQLITGELSSLPLYLPPHIHSVYRRLGGHRPPSRPFSLTVKQRRRRTSLQGCNVRPRTKAELLAHFTQPRTGNGAADCKACETPSGGNESRSLPSSVPLLSSPLLLALRKQSRN